MARLSRIVLVLRNLENSLGFYRDGLGLRVEAQSEKYARLCCSKGSAIELMAASRYVTILTQKCSNAIEVFSHSFVSQRFQRVPMLHWVLPFSYL